MNVGICMLKLWVMLKASRYNDVTRFDLARTLGGRGRYWTTCYLVSKMMIDTGCAHTADELVIALIDSPILRIVNTHTHEDHIGANGILQSQLRNVEILAHPQAIQVLSDPSHEQPLQLYRRIFWGWPEPSEAKAVEDDEIIEADTFSYRVIYTPGHSTDHICLYEQNHGWLFTGDLFVGGSDRALRAGYDIWQIIDSLKRVVELPISVLFPGSARVREQPQQELVSKISYLEELGGKILELHQSGWGVNAIVRSLLGGPMWVEIVTMGHFARYRLVNSYLGKNGDLR